MDSGMASMKVCIKCNTEKSVLSFSRNGKYLRNVCSDCNKKFQRQHYQENKPRYNECQAKRRQSGEHQKNQKLWNLRNRESVRKRNLKNKYGDPDIYEKLVKVQGEVCGICSEPSSNLFVDHCHKSGDVRGLLCRNCNSGIGLLKDSAEILTKAIEYVRRNS